MDEIFGVPVTGPNIALTLAGLVSAWLMTKNVPWAKAAATVLQWIVARKEPAVNAPTVSVGQTNPDPGWDFMRAMQDLHRLAHTPEEHQRLAQLTADWWSNHQKQPAPQTPQSREPS